MQNKPNLVRRRRIANVFITMDYEIKSDWTIGENKPNSNPIKSNLVRRRRIPKGQNEQKPEKLT